MLPGDHAVAERQKDLLRTLLAELPAAQSEALALHVVLGYSVEEVASATGVVLNTVRSRLRLAKEALRQRIDREPRWAELAEVGS
jgi:RNA polymerase sigma-70 factor (ECF subfamily)